MDEQKQLPGLDSTPSHKPGQPSPQSQATNYQAGSLSALHTTTEPPSSKKGIIVATVLGLAVIAGGIYAYSLKSVNSDNKEATNEEEEEKAPYVYEKPVTRQEIKDRIRREKQNEKTVVIATAAIQEQRWDDATDLISKLKEAQHAPEKLAALQSELDAGIQAEQEKLSAVGKLVEQARALDKGVHSPEAIKILDNALLISPDNAAALALREKINNYSITYHIPKDAATINELLLKIRAGDTIVLAAGTYDFSSIITKPVIIKGAGVGKTIINCDTTKQSAFVFQPSEDSPTKTSSLSDITVRGTTYQDFNIDRHPLILVKSPVAISKTIVEMSSGHGIAVISGTLNLSESLITANAWDGISVRGANAVAHISGSKIHTNYDHGIDFWEDASGSITKCEVYQNSGTGIVVMGANANTVIDQVRSYQNEQCGIVIMDKATAKINRSVAAVNKLSGIAVQGQSTTVQLITAISNNNLETGFYLDPNSSVSGYDTSTSDGNKIGKIVRKSFDFSIQRNAQ